jgi:hypothetical protein
MILAAARTLKALPRHLLVDQAVLAHPNVLRMRFNQNTGSDSIGRRH